MDVLIRTTALGGLILLAGCSNPGAVVDSASRLVTVAVDRARPKPFAAESVQPTDDELGWPVVLDEARQEQSLAILRSLADGHEPIYQFVPAREGVRWSDLPLAARYAGEKVEMAIRSRRITEDEAIFRLLTVDDRPAELVVRRTGDERVYEGRASVGRFENDDELSERLLQALHEQMLILGRKRALE